MVTLTGQYPRHALTSDHRCVLGRKGSGSRWKGATRRDVDAGRFLIVHRLARFQLLGAVEELINTEQDGERWAVGPQSKAEHTVTGPQVRRERVIRYRANGIPASREYENESDDKTTHTPSPCEFLLNDDTPNPLGTPTNHQPELVRRADV